MALPLQTNFFMRFNLGAGVVKDHRQGENSSTRRYRGNSVGMLYNGHERLERYNMPDTLRASKSSICARPIAYTPTWVGFYARSADSCGWHDTVCGFSDAEQVKNWNNPIRKPGITSATDELLPYRIGKVGLGEDLMPNLNWFTKVNSATPSNLSFVQQ